jgi:hypothetical protein
VVLIHRFDVLGIDLHCHKISSPNSSNFSQNRRFSLPSSAQIDEQLAQNFSKKCEPAKAGPIPAKAGRPTGPCRLARSAPLLATPSTCSTSARPWPRSARHTKGPRHRLVSAARHSCSPPALVRTHAWPQHRSTLLPPLLFPQLAQATSSSHAPSQLPGRPTQRKLPPASGRAPPPAHPQPLAPIASSQQLAAPSPAPPLLACVGSPASCLDSLAPSSTPRRPSAQHRSIPAKAGPNWLKPDYIRPTPF